jgi:hypothetical protein
MNGQEIRPGRWYYGLAAFIFVGGWVLFGIFLWKNLSGIADQLQQVVVPGKVQLNLPSPGNYTIYHEYESVVGSKIYSGGQTLAGLEVTLSSLATGDEVALSRANVDSTYSMGGRSGKAVFDFTIDRPGAYELTAQYPEGEEGPEVVLAVGQGFTGRILTTIFGALGIVFGSMVLAVAIALITAIKRHNAAKRAKDRYAL